MTTFWLSFTDSEATADKRFLGVAIFDMDESAGELSTTKIIKHAWALGVNPGGAVSVQEVGSIPDEHKNKLITDDARGALSSAVVAHRLSGLCLPRSWDRSTARRGIGTCACLARP